MNFLYFDTEHAINAQNFIIENSGGKKGIINIGLVDSVLQHIQNDWYYPEFENKVCHLFYSINKNHAFEDGNKRSSIVLAAYFLEVNGFNFKVSHFIKEMENIAVHVANNKIDKDFLQEIITSVLYDNCYNEELQLKIINAISNIEDFKQEETEF